MLGAPKKNAVTWTALDVAGGINGGGGGYRLTAGKPRQCLIYGIGIIKMPPKVPPHLFPCGIIYWSFSSTGQPSLLT